MAKKKKILFIVEAMGGGVFTYIVDFANELADTYDMYIAYAVRKQTPQNYKDYFDKRVHLIGSTEQCNILYFPFSNTSCDGAIFDAVAFLYQGNISLLRSGCVAHCT